MDSHHATKRRKTDHLTDRNSNFDEIFKRHLTNSLKKAQTRQDNPCSHSSSISKCYRKNPPHIAECAHPFHYCTDDIAVFKSNTDQFLNDSYQIYNENKGNFSLPWLSKVSARTGDEQTQFAQFTYTKFDSFYFMFLANLLLHFEDYITNPKYNYPSYFLTSLLQAFESNDATGLFKVAPDSIFAQKLASYKVREPTYVGNTTIQECIKNYASDESHAGGTKSRRKSKKSKSTSKSTNKKSTNKKSTRKSTRKRKSRRS
jgi:hypothetical protein